MSNRHLGQGKRYLGKADRKLISEHGEGSEDEDKKNTEAMSDFNECDMNLFGFLHLDLLYRKV